MKGHFEWESNHVNFTERYRPLVLFARFAGRKQVAVLPQSWCFELLTYYVKRLWNPCSWKKIRKKIEKKILKNFTYLDRRLKVLELEFSEAEEFDARR